MKLTTNNLTIEPGSSGGSIVIFETDDLEYKPEMKNKYDGKKMKVEVKENRGRRSLDANAYCWVLCDKIAAVKGLALKKVDVYRQAVRDYGVCENILLKNESVEKFVQNWNGDTSRYGKFADVMGASPNQPGYTWVRVYYGTSDYDSKEMSILLGMLITDAKDLGIDTITPAEADRLKSLWGER